jgi:hypothetical protein
VTPESGKVLLSAVAEMVTKIKGLPAREIIAILYITEDLLLNQFVGTCCESAVAEAILHGRTSKTTGESWAFVLT